MLPSDKKSLARIPASQTLFSMTGAVITHVINLFVNTSAKPPSERKQATAIQGSQGDTVTTHSTIVSSILLTPSAIH